MKIGENIRETLHKLPVKYVVHNHVYPKCVCQRCHDGVVMPEGPDNGLKADITVVADVVVQKYAEHKPLYRQQQAFERVGIPLRRQTLCDWIGWCSDQAARWCGPSGSTSSASTACSRTRHRCGCSCATGRCTRRGCGPTGCRGRR